MAHIVGVPKREPCRKCSLPVFLAERVNVGKNIYHRTCLKCARCKSQLSLGSFYETEIDGEFCCETCPDEESNLQNATSSPTATTSFGSSDTQTAVFDENESANRNIEIRSSIADRLAFFENSDKDGSHLLQKSVSDEEKSKSLKKIAAQYKPNAALTSFMNNTLSTNYDEQPDEISMEDNSKCDTTTAESSDEENENNLMEDKPPALPIDGPPVNDIDDEDNNDVLSVTIESRGTTNNNAIVNQIEQTRNDNALTYNSNSKVLLTSPSNKIINSNTTTQNQHNHYHNNNNTNNSNINNNDLNLSSNNVTKDISNIQNDNTQTRTTIDTEKEAKANNFTSTYNVELRKQNDSPKTDSATLIIDPTEQRLSVVRTRLQQFEDVLKSEDINNSRKSKISISSSNKLNNIENSKLDDKSVIKNIEAEEKDNINENVNLTGIKVPSEKSINTTESMVIKSEEESGNYIKENNNLNKMEIGLKFKDTKSTNILKELNNENKESEKTCENKFVADEMDVIKMDKEFNNEEQIKLLEDDKQTTVINVSNKSNNSEQVESEIISKNENDEIVAVEVEADQINHSSASIQSESTKSQSSNITTDENNINKQETMAIDLPLEETTTTTIATFSSVVSVTTSPNKKDVVTDSEENNYPDELNPFASDDDENNDIVSNTNTNENPIESIDKTADNQHNIISITDTANDQNRRKSLNPFDSSDDENNEQSFENQETKLKPPRPPPPKISKNPFGSESEAEDEDNNGSGNASIISMGSTKRAPLPTPRSQLTPSSKHNLTPEPTPRSTRQSYRHSLENSNELYGSNISLNSSITSPPNGKDSFNRQNDTRSSNNSLASSTGGGSGVNTMRSRKKKAPAPPPPTAGISGVSKTSKELFPPNDVESKKSTPTSSNSTTPQMSRKKRPAPKPPTGFIAIPKKNEVIRSSENVPQMSDLSSPSEAEMKSVQNDESYNTKTETVQKIEIEKLSDEEKVAHLDGRQFFLAATSTSNKVSEIHKKEDPSLNEISSDEIQYNIEPSQLNVQKTGDVECSQKTKLDKSLTDSENLNSHKENEQLNKSFLYKSYTAQTSNKSYTAQTLANTPSNEIQHDRHIEKIKDNKESKNRNRQSQHYNDDIHNDPLLNKSVQGKWKRRKGPAPSLPVPPRKILQMLPLQEIRHELEIIEVQQQGLEKQGVILETMIRERCEGKNGELIDSSGNLDEKQPNSKEVEDLILQLFELVNEKNELFRRQAELMYLRRQHRLEQEQADLEYEIRVLMAQPERNKTDSDKAREEALIARLIEVVQLRNEVIECLEMDRLREAEEDLSIKQRLQMHTAKRDEELAKQTPTKLSKKEKKKQKESKKIGKSKKIDADKDADESEISVETQKKKKKRKSLFSVLTTSSKATE